MSETERNKAVVKEFAAAYTRGDWDAVEALLTEDFRWIVPNAKEMQSPLMKAQASAMTYRDDSRDEAMATFRQTQTRCADGRFDMIVGEMVAEGDKVAVEAQSHAVNAETGRVYNNMYMWLMTLRDGKISQFREYQDTLHAFDVWMAP